MIRVLIFIFAFISCAYAQQSVFTSAFVANSAGNTGYSYRETVPNISVGGTQVRVTFNSTPSGVFSVAHASICVQASVQNCVAAPIELTTAGQSGFSISAASQVSDWANLTTTAGQSLLVIIDVTSSNMPRNSAGPQGWDSSASTWNVQSPGGTWNSFTSNYGFISVEVQSAAPPPPSNLLTSPGIPGGGRLTLVSGQSRLTQDTIANFIAYTPDTDVTVPMIGALGTVYRQPFNELILNLDSSWVSNSIHDAYIAVNGSTPVLCSVVWPSTDVLYNGVAANGSALTCRTSSTQTVTCPVNQCTHVGTFKISSVAGQIRCDFSQRQSPECGIWNRHNQVDMTLSAIGALTPANPQGVYTLPSSWSPVHFDITSSVSILIGRAGDRPRLTLDRRTRAQYNYPNSAWFVGIGWNSTSAPCGFEGGLNNESPASNQIIGSAATVHCTPPAFAGVGVATPLEWCVWGACQGWVVPTDILFEARYKN